ncbi:MULTISPECIES: ABC transporter permease [Paenibacillus]|uniref:ABC transporter permease n=1 Tax=Paenibacillus TaxID=44249 RepID=UPI002B4084B6|nr:ABC transporter permease [Paenibacillus polymyxa]URJ40135.3 ABC transporter permease [Paenibacillus polymyxa]
MKCELIKLKRKKFVTFVIMSAFLFPFIFTMLALKGSLGNVGVYDKLFQAIVGYGQILMLPIVLGIVATMLFFMERDHDTLKNLRTIPLSILQIVTSKLIVLFIFGFIFSSASAGSSIIGGWLLGGINDVLYKFEVGAIIGLLLTAGTLPIVIAIVFFNRSYIISIIIVLFYDIFNFAFIFVGLQSKIPIIKLLSSILPSSIIYRWHLNVSVSPSAYYYSKIAPVMLPLSQVVITIAIIAILSYFAIVQIYRKREV